MCLYKNQTTKEGIKGENKRPKSCKTYRKQITTWQ